MSEVEAPTSTEPKKGIKETLEFIEGLKVAVPTAVEIIADKKLSMKDVKPVIEAVKQHEVLVEAVKGADLIVPEAKDLDQVELAQIGMAVLPLFKLTQEAYQRGK